MSYPDALDSFTDIKVNGDSVTESVSLAASAAVTTKTLTYAISSGVSIPGYTEVIVPPAANQFKVTYDSKTVVFGPTATAVTLSVTYITRGTAIADLPIQGIQDAIVNVETTLGVNPQGAYDTVGDRITAAETAGAHVHMTEDLSSLCATASGGASFTLFQAPTIPEATLVILNGTTLTYNVDYSITGAVVTFGAAPYTGDKLVIHYITS